MSQGQKCDELSSGEGSKVPGQVSSKSGPKSNRKPLENSWTNSDDPKSSNTDDLLKKKHKMSGTNLILISVII